jgi:hypothetical protein
MTGLSKPSPRLLAGVGLLGALGLAAGSAQAQDAPGLEIYGFAQLDYTQDFNRVDPAWEDALRPSKIPTADGQFGDDGQASISVKQSRFGIKGNQEIAGKPASFKFEFDLFGTGVDAGQTTIRLRHFYGTWGPLLAGQTNSLFMDGDTFPNTVEYWGPTGMVFLRNPQIRYTWLTGGHEVAVAIEKPGNDIDTGNIRIVDPTLGSAIHGTEEVPDFTAHWKYTGGWGHVQLAGIVRQIRFETDGTVNNEPKGHETGWGLNLTSNIKVLEKDVIHLGVVYGEGIASYMNDGGTDLGPKAIPGVTPPIAGGPPIPPGSLQPKALPLLGLMAYYDHYWNDQWSSSIGWSQNKQDNSNFQQAGAYRTGQYASVNLLYTPDPRLLLGAEFIWGQRQDFGGAKGEDNRVQFTAKYSFSSKDFLR